MAIDMKKQSIESRHRWFGISASHARIYVNELKDLIFEITTRIPDAQEEAMSSIEDKIKELESRLSSMKEIILINKGRN